MLFDYARASDEKLIKAVFRRDVQAYGELYKRYLDEIYRYVYYRVANHPETEDLTQVVFIKAWEVISKNQPKKYNFRALVYRIAHNLIIDRWRTQKQELPLENFESLPDTALTPEHKMLSKEENLNLALSIKELEPQMQQVIICRFINDLSHAETAQTLGLTEGHVRVIQHRALKKIRLAKK
jgi:RNA polymerase sigma-70 factor (ECF subfamily)